MSLLKQIINYCETYKNSYFFTLTKLIGSIIYLLITDFKKNSDTPQLYSFWLEARNQVPG